MDLDEMKAVWSDLSDQLTKQKKMNQDIVIKMTQEKSNSRLGRIILMEVVGLIVSVGMLVYLIMNFDQLDYWPSIAGGVGMLLILGMGIMYGIRLIIQARKIDVITDSYAEVILQFDKLRKMLRLYKKLSIWVAAISPIVCIPLFFDLFSNKSVEDDLGGIALSILPMLLLIPLMLKFLFRYYSRNVSQVKKALNDIDFKD